MRQEGEGEGEGEGGREGQPGPSRECVRRAEEAMVLENKGGARRHKPLSPCAVTGETEEPRERK